MLAVHAAASAGLPPPPAPHPPPSPPVQPPNPPPSPPGPPLPPPPFYCDLGDRNWKWKGCESCKNKDCCHRFYQTPDGISHIRMCVWHDPYFENENGSCLAGTLCPDPAPPPTPPAPPRVPPGPPPAPPAPPSPPAPP
eukprot:scaffold25567_cov121-Isochrysis_galbana.AAC.6